MVERWIFGVRGAKRGGDVLAAESRKEVARVGRWCMGGDGCVAANGQVKAAFRVRALCWVLDVVSDIHCLVPAGGMFGR